MGNKTYTNNTGKLVLEYESPDSIILNLTFILTKSQRLEKNGLYMKLERTSTRTQPSAIQLLNFQEYQGEIYLNVQEISSNRCYNLSWNLNYEGEYWLWSISDFETLTNL